MDALVGGNRHRRTFRYIAQPLEVVAMYRLLEEDRAYILLREIVEQFHCLRRSVALIAVEHEVAIWRALRHCQDAVKVVIHVGADLQLEGARTPASILACQLGHMRWRLDGDGDVRLNARRAA